MIKEEMEEVDAVRLEIKNDEGKTAVLFVVAAGRIITRIY